MPSLKHIVLAAAILVALPFAAFAQSTATGVSRDFNPAISVNALLLGRVADNSTSPAVNGMELQEAEVRFTSIVDPYWKADLVFAVHPEIHAEEEEGEEHEDEHAHGGYAGDIEVVTVEGQALPGGFGLKIGKDYLPFGKHVPLHTHQFPFINAPLAITAFLGDHGLTEVGARAAHDIPLPWYVDLEAYVVDGRSEIFDDESRELAAGARWVNMFDVSDESTLEVSGSWLNGPQSPYYLAHEGEEATGKLNVWGADVTWKWVSASSSKGPAVILTGEVVLPRSASGEGDPFGWYVMGQTRFARNWWLGLETGEADKSMGEEENEGGEEEHDHGELFGWEKANEYKANITWAPSEFSAVRFEVAHYQDKVGDADDTLFSLQVNFTIGSHPAHSY